MLRTIAEITNEELTCPVDGCAARRVHISVKLRHYRTAQLSARNLASRSCSRRPLAFPR